jgi:hypothetical protein
MKEVVVTQLTAGTSAMMLVGSPVRQWVRSLRDNRRWLTPLHYTPAIEIVLGSIDKPTYVEVKVAKVMLPYAIVCHRIGRGWMKLWIDTREVTLYASTPQ